MTQEISMQAFSSPSVYPASYSQRQLEWQPHHHTPIHACVGSCGALCMWNHLHVDNNHRATLLNEILHIHFSHLVELRIMGNNIESVEALPTASMPCMQSLYLCTCEIREEDNSIVWVRVLRKVRWPSLSLLLLRLCFNYSDNNKIKDGRTLSQCCMWKLKTLWLYSAGCQTEENEVQPNFIPKLHIQELDHLCLTCLI